MIDLKRKVPRFSIKFIISSNEIKGKGINISQKGLGFLSNDEIIPAESIPFQTKVKGYIFSKRIYSINGVGRLLYSVPDKENKNFYYNGFEFLRLEESSQEDLYELLNDIYQFQKKNNSHIENKTLSDFVNYPSNDLFHKANIFYNIIKMGKYKNLELFPFYRDANKNTFIEKNSLKKKQMITLCSDDYLGLNVHPEIIKTYNEAVKKYGISNASVISGGVFTVYKKLEEELADFVGKQNAIIFNSLYSANSGIITSLLRPNDVVLNDEYNHISLINSNLLTKSKSLIFLHNNINSLDRLLNRVKLKFNGILVAVSGIYNNSGDTVELDKIIKLIKKYNAKILIDESDAFGIIGKTGIGAAELFNSVKKVDLIVSSLNKAIGGAGAFVAGDKEVIEYLRYYSSSYLFSPNIQPAMAEVILKSLEILKKDKSIKEKLISNIKYFKNGFEKFNIKTNKSESAIFSLFIPDKKSFFKISQSLFDKGIFHNALTYPSAPMGGSIIKFTVSALHSEKELDKALNIIHEICKKEGILDILK